VNPTDPGAEPEVLAAGGVVVEPGTGRIAVIHRPKYDDWSLPKGKLEDEESFEDGALREVEEETGFRCTIDGVAGEVRYRDRRDRAKLVRYYRMTPTGGAFVPHDEVDELLWLDPEEAVDLLTYAHDRELL
jgi:8-oxo-dGTP diphosphatase